MMGPSFVFTRTPYDATADIPAAVDGGAGTKADQMVGA
jgi:hypothetical protein